MATTGTSSQGVRTAERGGDRAGGGSADGVRRATGRSREEWFALLDASGVAESPYGEIAGLLVEEHRLSRWWAQKLTVEYQQARGHRAPGVRPDGSFTVSASRTVAAPAERVFAAFDEAKLRKRWLSGVALRKRAADPGRSIRFAHEDGVSHLDVGVAQQSGGKTQITIEHARIADADTAAAAKLYWRERLTALKTLLEA